jgi:hypothetical protein
LEDQELESGLIEFERELEEDGMTTNDGKKQRRYISRRGSAMRL